MDSFLHQPGFSSADPDPPARTFSLPSHDAAAATDASSTAAPAAANTANGNAQNQLSPPNANSIPNESSDAAAASATAVAAPQEGA